MNKGTCSKCGQAIEFRAVDVKGQESYWFHTNTSAGSFKRHNARPAKIAA
jgi:hypothetical protein